MIGLRGGGEEESIDLVRMIESGGRTPKEFDLSFSYFTSSDVHQVLNGSFVCLERFVGMNKLEESDAFVVQFDL